MKNFFLTATTLIITLALIEIFLRLCPGLFQYGQKYYLNGNNGNFYANCYSSPPQDGFTLQLNTKDKCAFLYNKYRLKRSFLTKLIKQAPYCIDYNIEQRHKGFFPDRKKELFITGDSFAFGEGVPDQATIAYLLSERLPAYNVRNFAESAANIEHIIKQFETIAEHNESPRIIYFYNLNDPLHSDAVSRDKRLIADFENLRPERIDQSEYFWKGWDKLKFINLIKQAWVLSREKSLTIKYYHRIYFGPENAPEMEETLNIIRRMNETVHRENGRFILVIWPLIHKDLLGRYPFQDIHEKIKRWCSQNDIICFDGLEAFREYRSMKQFRVHPVDYHPNLKANKIMVDFLVNALE